MNARTTLFLFVALLTCSTVSFFYGAPFVTFAITNIALYIGLRTVLTNSGAVATAIVFSFLALGMAPLVSKQVHIPLTTIGYTIFVCLILISGAMRLFVSKTEVPQSISAGQTIIALAALAPSVFTGVALWVGGNLAGDNLGWMLAGDAQTNTDTAIEILSKNGIPSVFATLSQSSMAFFIGGSLDLQQLDTSFIPIMQIQSLALFGAWAIASILFGLIANRGLSLSPPLIRMLIVFLGASFPLSWFILGFSVQAGFYNSPFALISLASAWLIWRDFEMARGKVGIPQLAFMVAAVFLAALAWTPLAIIPTSLLAVAYVRYVIPIMARNSNRRIIFIGLNLLMLTGALFFVPVVVQNMRSASADGFMTELPPQFIAVIFILAIFVAVTARGSLLKMGSTNAGLLAVTVSGALGIALLSLQAAGSPFTLSWAYYPRKAAWFMSFFILFILFMEVFRRLFWEMSLSKFRKVLGALCLTALLSISVRNVPYWASGPLKAFPMLAIATSVNDTSGELNEISDALNHKQVRLEYGENDFIVNQWVFQWLKFKNQPPVWSYAYSPITTPRDVCSLASAWGGQVTLLTQNDEIRVLANQQCGQLLTK